MKKRNDYEHLYEFYFDLHHMIDRVGKEKYEAMCQKIGSYNKGSNKKGSNIKKGSCINKTCKYAALKKSVRCIETGVIYESITDAAKEYNIYISVLSRCCRGEVKTAGGYHWEFYEEEKI
jgi:hypothetical protein